MLVYIISVIAALLAGCLALFAYISETAYRCRREMGDDEYDNNNLPGGSQ